MSFNKIFIIGHVGREPRIEATAKGSFICYLAVATDQVIKKEKITTWYQVVLLGSQAERAKHQLTKGAKIYVEGRLRPQQMKDKEGKVRTVLEITADEFCSLTSIAQ